MSELAKMVKSDRHWSRIEALVDEQGITDTSLEGMRFDIRQCAAAGARAGYAQALRAVLDLFIDLNDPDTFDDEWTSTDILNTVEKFAAEGGIDLEAGT